MKNECAPRGTCGPRGALRIAGCCLVVDLCVIASRCGVMPHTQPPPPLDNGPCRSAPRPNRAWSIRPCGQSGPRRICRNATARPVPTEKRTGILQMSAYRPFSFVYLTTMVSMCISPLSVMGLLYISTPCPLRRSTASDAP